MENKSDRVFLKKKLQIYVLKFLLKSVQKIVVLGYF